MKRYLALILSVFIVYCSQDAFAKLDIVSNDENKVFDVFITEKITEDDYKDLLTFVFSFLDAADSADVDVDVGMIRFMVKLNSTGGSVDAAMNIGRLLRQTDSMAVVYHDSKCFSACVYILAGAKRRAVDGEVGVHRPYDAVARLESEEDQKELYRLLENKVKKYLSEVNIPTRLYDDSLFIAPEKIKILTVDEVEEYGLSVNDPYTDEADSVQEAKRIGISRAELAARYALADRSCIWDGSYGEKSIKKLHDCRLRIIEK